MSKSLVSSIVSDVKILADYDISDTALDTMILKTINYAIKKLRNWMIQYGIYEDTTAQASFKTIAKQEYVDITKAHIVGDATTFTPVALDSLTVTIDGTGYTVLMAGCTTIALVVAAINTAVGSTVAVEDDNGYLQINSLTTGSTSAVTIASLAGTPAARLFTVAAERTQSAVTDLDEILKVSDRSGDRTLWFLPYQKYIDLYPDPTSDYSSDPDFVSRFSNRIYFGPTPSQAKYLYFDYIKMMAAVTSTSTMPFTDEYDEFVVAMCLDWLYGFFDSKDRASFLSIREKILQLKSDLIIHSPKRIIVDNQVSLRDEGMARSIIAPRYAE